MPSGKRGPPKDVTVDLLERHEAQHLIVRQRKRYNVLDCGRRFGKTALASDLLIDGVDENDKASLLRGGKVGYFVPEGKTANVVWDELKTLLAPITAQIDSQSGELYTFGGGRMDFWTMKSRMVGRGRKYHRVIIDEAAYEPDLKGTWELAIRPTLTDYRGDAWFMSSPNGPGFFKVLFDRGQSTHRSYDPMWASWRMRTADNPYIDPEEIEQARRDLSDASFRQEYLAEFVDKLDGWFKRDWLRYYREPVNAENMTRVLLVDPASGKRKHAGEDYSVWWVLGLHEDNNYYVLDFVREHFNLSERVAMTIGLHRLYRPHITAYEDYGMQADIQAIEDQQEREGYRFAITPVGGTIAKADRIERLVPVFKQGRFWFPGPQLRGPQIQLAHRAVALWWEDEVMPYPAGDKAHDDGLDGLARIFDCGAEFPKRLLPQPSTLLRPSLRPPSVRTTF